MEIKPRLFYWVVKNLGRPRPLRIGYLLININSVKGEEPVVGKSGSTTLWYSCTQVSLLGSPSLQSETYSLKDHSLGGSSTLHRAARLSEGRLLMGEVSIYNTVTYSQAIETPNFFSQIFFHQYQTFLH